MAARVKRMMCILLTCVLIINSVPVMAAAEPMKGIDVSVYNGTVDWDKVRAQGYDYVMIKTGDGKDTGNHEKDIDPQFAANYDGARAAGMLVGVYHVCSTRTVAEARLEAQYCLSILDGRELDFPVAYDIEMDGTFSTGRENVSKIAVAFSEVIEAAGYTPMIYSSANYFNSYFDYNIIKDYKIWVAQYGTNKPNLKLPYTMWQYTDKGSVDGANTSKGYCDINYYYPPVPATKLTMGVTTLTVGVNELYHLKTIIYPAKSTDTLTFTSSNKGVAAVSQKGTIKGLKTGRAIITVKTTSGLKRSVSVVVKKAPGRVTFVKKPISLKVKKTFQLQTKVTAGCASNKITYRSSNPAIASVSPKGLVTAKKKGIVTISATTYNKKTVSFRLKIS